MRWKSSTKQAANRPRASCNHVTGLLLRLTLLFRISGAHVIARRYFVVNGFDGALAMLGIVTGFYVSGETDPVVIRTTCIGAAIALAMSGISSAYVSETAERRRELRALEEAMIADLEDSVYGQARQLIPAVIALVNGLAPLVISLLIILPFWLSALVPAFSFPPLESSMVVAMAVIFLLGVFLGKISDTFWLLAGVQTLAIAIATCGIIYLFTG